MYKSTICNLFSGADKAIDESLATFYRSDEKTKQNFLAIVMEKVSLVKRVSLYVRKDVYDKSPLIFTNIKVFK